MADWRPWRPGLKFRRNFCELSAFSRLRLHRIRWVSLLVAAVITAGLVYLFVRSWRSFRSLDELPEVESAEVTEDILVIVPARNEEANIARVISSFPPGWVLVVDDDSQDGTAERAIANTAAVVYAPPLRPGQNAKSAACAAGAKATVSKWILFADADTWYAEEFLASAVDFADRAGLDLLSVFPAPVCKSLWELAVTPFTRALFFCSIDAGALRLPKNPKVLINGQCLLVRRSFYDFVGGHAGIVKNLMEDVALSRVAERHRAKAAVVRADKLAFARMYPQFLELLRGLARNSFRLLETRPEARTRPVLASILAAAWLPALGFLAWEDQMIAASVFAVVPTVTLWPWYGGPSAVLAPLGICLFQPIALWALIATVFGAKISWKDRSI